MEAAQARRENTAAAMWVIFDTLTDSASWVGDNFLDNHKVAVRERYSDEQLITLNRPVASAALRVTP